MPGNREDLDTKLDIYEPIMSRPTNGSEVCDPKFFRPNDHSQHMKDWEPTQEGYLNHMIPHHHIAIDMSKRLLLHTTHPYMIAFCRKLIIDQQGEIYYMNNMLQNQFNYQSELLGQSIGGDSPAMGVYAQEDDKNVEAHQMEKHH